VSGESASSFLSICPVCQNPIDVSALEPFSKIACPHCGQLVRVRRNFDHFKIIKQIGEGGMSRVFEAEDETLGRRVALKILNRQFSRDAARVESFKREALVTARISHLNVIKLYSTGEDHGYFYIAMELVGGGSLEQRIKNQGRLPEEDVLRIGLEVAEGLRAAQKDGLLHRDVKPANILFTDTGTAKVVDFGLAIFVDAQDEADTEIWATPYYVSPEKVIENTEDFRSDIFSLGATLYHALTGKPPHKANTASLSELRKIKSEKVVLEDTGLTFSPRTAVVVNRMLAISPEKRHPNYEAVLEDLRVAQRMVGGRVRLLGSRRQRFLAVSAAAVVLAFLVGWLARSTGERAVKSIKVAPVVPTGAVVGGGVTLTAGQATVGERFRQGREKVILGEVAEARRIFEELLKEGMRQPTVSWARVHLTVCAMELGDAEAAQKVLKELAENPNDAANGEGELAPFFRALGSRLTDRWAAKWKVAELKYRRESEEVMGYLLHGLAQWHFGDVEKGREALQFFFDSMPTLKAWSSTQGAVAEWIPAYAEGLQKRYGPDMEVAGMLATLKAAGDAEAVRGSLKLVEEMSQKLRTGGALKKTLEKRIQTLKRDEVKLRLADHKSELEEQDARRKRELEQLQDLTELLPSLVQGQDYSRAVDVLESMTFQSREVKGALEAKTYLYSQARAFIELLSKDVSAKPWRGTVRRVDGATVQGLVSAVSGNEMMLTLDRGGVVVPMSVVAPETLVEMATAYVSGVTDSTEYYRRQELTAVFARITGLNATAAMIAAPLMEENREFRMRWLKVL
jgi:hypothetical protein